MAREGWAPLGPDVGCPAVQKTERDDVAIWEGSSGKRIYLRPTANEHEATTLCRWLIDNGYGPEGEKCERCDGTDAIDTPFSDSDPSCPDCDGEGYIKP